MSSTLIRMARLPVAYQRNAPFVAIWTSIRRRSTVVVWGSLPTMTEKVRHGTSTLLKLLIKVADL
jgi:hypothetical protein